tara:strand:+ start:141 stop:323 length:183 start_codon:yes stop_codon:yes gene_type:complete
MDNDRKPQKLAYTIKEFCIATSIGRTKVYELIGGGKLLTVKLGSKTLIKADEAQRFLGEL